MKSVSYGWALKVVRTRPVLDLSQHDLSHKTGISVSRLSKIESGYLEPSDKELATLCKALRYRRDKFQALAERGEPIVEVRP